MTSTLSRTLFPAIWAALIATGFGQVWRYESTPGRAAESRPAHRMGRIALDPTRPTIVLFAHPECPCTRASLAGLTALEGQQPGRARIVVVVSGVGGSPNEVAARRVQGAIVVADPLGTEARRWGAETSGQTFAFAPNGKTLFQGGLTEVRGHYGPSAGLDALGDILRRRPPPVRSTPVFGCAMQSSESAR